MKHVFEMDGPQHTTAWSLLWDGKPAGKLIANWSKNRNGTVCYASVYIYNGPLDMRQAKNQPLDYSNVGKAGGYGYDKLSQAVWQCLKNAGITPQKVQPGNGQTREEFEAWGYTVIEVI